MTPEPESGAAPSALLIAQRAARAEALGYFVERSGFHVEVATSIDQAVRGLEDRGVALVVADWSARPGEMETDMARLRALTAAPILLLAPRTDGAPRSRAEEILRPPFTAREIESRVRSMTGAAGRAAPQPALLAGGPVQLDILRHEARVREEPVFLRVKEFDLLEAFLRRMDQMLSRAFLTAVAWGIEMVPGTNTLDVHIARLRKKIELSPHRPLHLLTVRRRGYCFVDGFRLPATP